MSDADRARELAELNKRILTIPNAFSFVRLLCVPLFLWLLFGADHPVAAAWLLAGLGGTDWVDGYIARHWNQGSDLGKILDPTADRLLLIAAAIALLFESVPGAVKLFVVIVLVRETLVGITTVTLGLLGARRIDVLWVGKTGTFFIMLSLPMLVLAAHISGFWHGEMTIAGWICGVLGLGFGYYAAAQYIPAARGALRDGRNDRAAFDATSEAQ